MQEHRYDPGYWTTEWTTKGRVAPFQESIRKAQVSSFYRALALCGAIGTIPIGVFSSLRYELPYAWLWCALTVAGLFFGLWYFIHKAMIRNKVRPDFSETKQPQGKEQQ